MSKLKIINNIMRIENWMGVYRNYSVISVRRKYLVKIYVLLMIGTHFVANINLLRETIIDLLKFSFTYSCFVISYNGVSIINNVVVLIMSCYHSALFQIFITNIDDINVICEDDAIYQDLIKKLNKRFFNAVLVWSGIIWSLLIIYLLNGLAYFGDVFFLIQAISDLIQNFRYFWEILAFHLFIEIMVMNIEYLNSSISAATNKINTECEEILEKIEEARRISQQLQKWGDVCGHLVVANACLGYTFGLQVLLSLWSSIFYYIVLLYISITLALNKELANFAWVGTTGFLTILTAYFLTKLSMLWSGQRARNAGRRLDAALARLRVRLLPIPGREAEACACAAASLARRVRAAPLRLRLLSARPLQMALLAEIVGVVANYTIVLLQFNHVV